MRRRPFAAALAAVLVAAGMVSVGPGPASAQPTAAFPAGRWKGFGVLTGGIARPGINAGFTSPGTFTFEVEVGADGEVVDGTWTLSGAHINSNTPGGSGTVDLSGSGPLGGNGTRVTLTGTLSMSGTITVQGITIDVASVLGSLPAEGAFSASYATCNTVSGDLATEGRQAQTAAGFSTSVKGPFTAKRIAKAGQNLGAGFDEAYTNLVDQIEQLALSPTPSAADVVALVDKVDAFYAQVFGSSKCPGGPKNLVKGKQPYSYFVGKLGELLSTALDNAGAYSASDLQALMLAAIHLGLIGSAAPDPQLAGELTGKFGAALELKLEEAKANDDKTDCFIVYLAATAGGYKSIASDAAACAK